MRDESNDTGRLLLGCLLYTAGSAILYVSPAYLADLGARFGIDEARMGALSAAENIGIGLASFFAMWWNGRVGYREAAMFGVLACLAGDAISFVSHNFAVLLLARFATGLLGEGTLFVLAFLVLASVRNPDRALGFALTAVVLFGSLVLGAASFLNGIPGGTAMLLPLAAIALAVLPVLRWMPVATALAAEAADRQSAPATDGWRALLAVIAMAVWFGAPGGFWTFADAAAASRQVSPGDIDTALAIGNAVGLLGSALAAWQGNRWGRGVPILAGTIGLCLSVAAFHRSVEVVALAATLAAFNIFWNYATVYQMALVVALDRTGRATAAISAAQVLGFAAGGFLSGFAIVSAGYSALTAVVAVFAVAGVFLLALCFRACARVIAEAE
jgi:predicted MFS family arabinose efflux permease